MQTKISHRASVSISTKADWNLNELLNPGKINFTDYLQKQGKDPMVYF